MNASIFALSYLEPSQLSKMKLFAKIVNSFQPLTILAKGSILDVWLGSECAFGKGFLLEEKLEK